MADLVHADPEQAKAVRRRFVRYHLHSSARGLVLSALLFTVVLSGLLPLGPFTATMMLWFAMWLGITRTAQGIWAIRVQRHLLEGWTARALPGRRRAPTRAVGSDRHALAMLTDDDDPLLARARAEGHALVERMDELKTLLADPGLNSVLRRPLAEERARVEQDLETLVNQLSELSRRNRTSQDVFDRLTARLEVDKVLPGRPLLTAEQGAG